MDKSLEKENREKALIVGLALHSKDRWREADRLEELALLAETAGAQVFEKILQIREKPDPSTYIGKGKAKEIREIVENYNLDLVIFDTELSPSQVRNLEEIIGCKIVDRTELVMDIFAQHARTAEAKIQIELAQLLYRLSRLTGRGVSLSRLGGGIGTRGPGEKKLEVDRRRILERIAFLKKKLENIERTKELQRKRRKELLKISLVGYTNTGKSSIMNVLTKAGVVVEDQLFATVDATTRILYLEDFPHRVLLSDTVGFIEDIPPDLIASFKATLGVVKEADILLHIIDVTHPRLHERIRIVEDVLDEISCGDKPKIRVFNKIDLLLERSVIDRLKEKYVDSVFVSAKTREGIGELKQKIKEILLEKVGELKTTSLE
jgi:GTP-binding protein HflX